MGEPRTFSERTGLTRSKAILIGLLAVVLVTVIYIQIGRYSGGDVVAEGLAVPEYRPPRPAGISPLIAQAAADVPAASTRLADTAVFDQSKWKPPELAAVTAYDPFALPAAFPQPPAANAVRLAAEADASSAESSTKASALAEAVESLRMELTALQERGVHVIVRDGNKYVALIGDRTVHVGEDIEGFTVTAIEPDGVQVERKVRE